MRPPVLNPLFVPLSALPGIGPKLEKVFARLIRRDGEPPRLTDLLFHLLVVLKARDVKLSDVEAELAARTGQSGLAERASRKGG